MFYSKNLQTKNEIEFFEKLKFIFKDYHIATQVALSAIIETDNYKERPQFNTYYIDFVICDKKGEKPLLIIELDDYTHKTEHRRTQDKRKNGVIQSAGIPFIRYEAKNKYNITDIANNTIPYLKGSKTPPIYETLQINETQNEQKTIYHEIIYNFKLNVKKYLINKLKKLIITTIIFFVFIIFMFTLITKTIPKKTTDFMKETQNSIKIKTLENKNKTNLSVPAPVTKTDNDTITKPFQKIITDIMKAGQNSIKYEKNTPPKNKKNINENEENITDN